MEKQSMQIRGQKPIWKSALNIFVWLILLLGLHELSHVSFFLFHEIVEIFCIVIAGAIFIFAWNSMDFTENTFFLICGIAFLFTGLIDLLHSASYGGRNIITGFGPDLATQLWISARYLQAIAFILAAIYAGKKVKSAFFFHVFAFYTVVVLLSIFYFRIFPVCMIVRADPTLFAESVSLTPFKIFSEYIISFLFLTSLYLLVKKRERFSSDMFKLLAASITLSIFSELCFSHYNTIYGTMNIIGHYLKLFSYFLIYKAILEIGYKRPYALLFSNLRQREIELKSEKEYSENLIDTAQALVFVTDINGAIISLNSFMGELLEYEQHEIKGKNLFDLFYSEKDKLEKRGNFVKCLYENRSCSDTIILKSKSGKFIETECRGRALKDHNGNITGLVIVGIDETKRKQAERALIENEEKYKNLFRAQSDAIILFDSETLEIIDANHAAVSMYGFSYDEFKKLKISEIIVDPDKIGIDSVRIPSGEIATYPLRYHMKKNGSVFPVEINAGAFMFRDRKYICEIIRDITDRLKAANEIRESESRLRMMTSQVPALIWIVDKELKLTSASGNIPGFDLRHATGTLKSRTLFEFFKITDTECTLMAAHGKALNGETGKYEYFAQSGIVLDCTVEPLKNNNDEIIGIIGIGIDITQRKKAENTIIESEARLKMIAEQVPAVIWTVDKKMKFTSTFGSSKRTDIKPIFDNVENKNLIQYFGGNAEHHVVVAHKKALEGVKNKFEMFTQERIFFDCTVEPLRNKQGNIVGAIGIAVDITDRKNQENAAIGRESRMRLMMSQTPAIIWTTDENLVVASVFGSLKNNDIMTIFFGMKNVSLFDYIKNNPNRRYILEAHQSALNGEKARYESEIQGSYFDITVEPLVKDNGKIIGTIAVAIDFTERKKIEETLNKREEELRLLNEQLPGVIWTVDKELRYTYVTGTDMSNKLKAVMNNVYGLSLYEYFGTDDPNYEPIACHLKALDGITTKYEISLDKYFDITVSPLKNKKGEIIGAVGVGLDITERKQMENELIEKNRELDDFAYMVSHDIKSPLITINEYMNTAEADPERLTECFKNVRYQAERLMLFVDSVLQLSRAGKIIKLKEEVELDDVIRAAVLFGHPKEKVEINISNTLPRIKGDPERIEKAITNIIDNAINWKDPEKEKLIVEVNCKADKDGQVICIKDNGLGIDREYLEKIFTPSFSLRRDKGTGFGLAITKKIVEAHGGKIWAHSEGRKKGASFFLRFPA